jgi:hypothetical protein
MRSAWRSAFRNLVRPNYRPYPVAGSQNDELIDIVMIMRALLNDLRLRDR